MITGQLNWWLDPASIAESLKHNSAREVVSEFYLCLRLPVYGYLHSSLNCPQEAEDLTQEVFVRLYQELQQGGRIYNLRSWIFSVAHNLAMDAHRRETRDHASAGLDEPADTRNPESLLLREERHRKMDSALKRLSSRERQCLELRAEGLRYREIAQVLQVGIPAVQSFLSRAVAKLKEDG